MAFGDYCFECLGYFFKYRLERGHFVRTEWREYEIVDYLLPFRLPQIT